MIHHITRATRHLIFWSLIATAVGLTGLRLLLLGIDYYKSDLAGHISELIGTPVTIGHLGANMRGFNPQLKLTDIAIASVAAAKNQSPAIQFNEIRLGIDVSKLLSSRDLLASSWVTLVGAKLSIKRQQDGSIAIVGLKAGDGQPEWLLQGGKYEVLHSNITWIDETGHGKPLLFDGAALAIINDGALHRLNLLVKLPKKVGDTLTASMEVNGNIFKPASTQGRVYINGKAVFLAELAAFAQNSAEPRIQLNSGNGDFEVWADWQPAQLTSIDVAAQLQKITLTRPDKQTLSINALNTRLHGAINDAGKQWRFDVNEFALETGKKWPAAVFSVSGRHKDDNALTQLGLFVQQLDVQEAAELAQFFAPLTDEQSKLLAQAHLKGTLTQLSGFADLETSALALNGQFSGFSVSPVLSAPGIDKLNGQIRGDEKQGTITLTAHDAKLTAPGLFRETLPVNHLQGTLGWQQTDDSWSLSSNKVELDSSSFHTESRFHIDIPKADEPVFMDWQSAFTGADVREVRQYLPARIMDEDVLAWLDNAFISGRMTNGGLLIYGKLSDFPFENAPGVFEALFTGEQFELSYDPEWPHLVGMNAEVQFLQGGLKVDILQAQSASQSGTGAAIAKDGVNAASQSGTGAAKVIIKQAEVTIPSLDKSRQLLVKGEAEASIADALSFMQQTPLHASVDSLLEAITPQGNTRVTLDLKIPLVNGAPTKVDGAAHMKEARLMVKSLALPVSKITGALKFNEQGVYSDAIQAMALGHPLQATIANTKNEVSIKVDGRAGVSDLHEQFDLPWWHMATGETDYQLQLALPYDDAAPVLKVDSMLSGMSLNLPGALAKTREQKKPLSLHFSLSDKPLLPLLLNYDNKLKAALQLDTRNKTVHSGHIVVGAGDAVLPEEAGLKLEINQERLALHDWLILPAAENAVDIVKEVKIHSAHALWKKADLGAFDLLLNRNGDYWLGTIDSSIAKGSLQLPAGSKTTDTIKLNMTLLDLSALKQASAKDASPLPGLSPKLAPLLTLTSDTTLWQSVDLGRLSLVTERSPDGMVFKQAELISEQQKITLTGDWTLIGGQSTTHVQGNLAVPQAGQLLAKLGLSKDLTETSAVVDFAIDWKGAPYQFSLTGMKGHLNMNLQGGRILSIEPGVGRVLGILAMAQWIKRAQLDFSDIYQEGLSFNSIEGHFDLAGGIASTQNLVIDAIPAKIAISGDTNLVRHSVDYIVNVTPKSADAVPIAGTIMGKIAGLIGRTLTGKDQEGFFFGSQYLVKGPWDNAEVIPMHKNDGLLQKTWNGITGFPWLEQQKEENTER
ncbi:MAG: YhdP family protein [Methylobacter sp.]|nr:YhdP family protein [Methylobacter sp.]